MNDMEYLKMLEIPVNSSEVTFKPTRKTKKDVKKQVIQKVNLQSCETVENQKPERKSILKSLKEKNFFKSKTPKVKRVKQEKPKSSVEIKNTGFDVVSMQVVTIFVLIVGIILTNIFVDNSGINRLMRSVFAKNDAKIERSYSDFTALSPTKSGNVSLSDGVMTISKGSVYSPCDGVVESLTEEDGKYILTVSHSDSFSSVISGLESVYLSVGDNVYSTIPVGYSEQTAYVSMFDNDSILTGYTVDDDKIVWL
ncbi:MAG: hypothetical protein IKJ14_05835 [Clostridia bacterium]|nr:hypothetical protein [Clostridia bacterium]